MKMSIVITCICAVVAVSMAAMNGNGGYNIMNMGMNGMNMGMNGMNMGMNQNWAWNSNMMNRLMNMNQNWNMNNGWNNMRNSMARRGGSGMKYGR